MSSTPQRQGLSKTQYLSNGVKSFRSVQTRLFAASAFLLVAAFFSVNVLAVNPNQSVLASSSANTQQAGFVASTISDLISFFGFAEAAPARNENDPKPEPTPPIYDEADNVKIYPDVDPELSLLEATGNFSGDTTGAPVFNRPTANGTAPPVALSGGATAVAFRVNQFTVDANGSYTITSNTSTYDGFLCVYAGSFNPATPLVNALQCNDDFVNTRSSQVVPNLVAGTQYFAVNTAFSNGSVGAFTTSVVGPGNVFGQGVGACAPPPAGMTAWFAGNGNTTDTAPADAVDDVATLTNGAAFGPGRVGQGFVLDGVNDHVAVANPNSADLDVGSTGTGISMDAWINPTSFGTGRPIAEYGNPTDTGVHFWHSVAGLGGNGSLFVNVVDDAGLNHFFFTTTTPLTLNSFQHVAFTYDFANNTPNIYYNGVAQPLNVAGLNLANFLTPAETDYPLNIGARLDASPNPPVFFAGTIDEFQLFNNAIRASDVAAIFNAGGNGVCSSTFQFSTAAQTTPEAGGPSITVTVTRTGDLANPASVQVSTLSGTAVSTDGTGCAAGNDFQGFSAANPILLNFAANVASQAVTLLICDDAVAEPDEMFSLNLSNATGGASIGAPATQTVTITDGGDSPVSVTVAPAAVAEDGAANLIYTFARPNAGAGAITVNFSVTGTATGPPAVAPALDYACSAGTGATAVTCNGATSTVTFGAAATTAIVIVDPTPDTLVEGTETVIFTVTAPTPPAANYTVGTPPSATGMITEDDTNVSVAVAPLTVAEDGVPNLVYTFTRSGATPAGQVVNFTIGGTACSLAPCTDNFPPDYTQTGATSFTGTNGTVAGTGTVTFGVAGSLTATVTVDPTADTNVETSETVIFTVTGSTDVNGVTVIPTAPTSATGTILDNDTTYTIAATPANGLEGNTNLVPNPQAGGAPAGSFATFTVTRTGDLTTTGQVNISTVPIPLPNNNPNLATPGAENSACGLVAGVDYITDGDTLTFLPTVATMTFTVAVCGDLTFELNETFDAVLTNPVNGTVGVPARATYSITNDDGAPVLNISDAQAAEGGNVVFTVTQSIASGVATTFRFCTVDVTATDGANPGALNPDYTGQPCPGGSGIFTIAAGSLSSNAISIPTNVDLFFEGPETFLVNLIDVTNATIGDGQGVGTISDGQQPNTFTLDDVARAEGSVPAGTTTFNFTLRRSAPAQTNQLVCIRTQAGTTIPPGNANPATPGTAPGNPPGADYTEITSNPPNNCFLFTPGGPDTVFVPVIVYQDTVFENDESFTVLIESVTGGPVLPAANFSDTGLGTIINDENAPTLAFNPTSATVVETDTGTTTLLTFTVVRTGDSQLSSTVNYVVDPFSGTTTTPRVPATAGTTCTNADTTGVDFITPIPTPPATANTLTFPATGTAGSTSQSFSVTVCGDVRDEADEAVRATLSAPVRATIPGSLTATGTIVDNDLSGVFTVNDVTMAEGNSGITNFTFRVMRTGSTDQVQVVTVSTIDGTATVADLDYNQVVSRQLTFPLNPFGNPALNFIDTIVEVRGDLNFETDERFTLQIDGVTTAGTADATGLDINRGADPQGLGTITNDDGPRTFAIDNVTQSEGNDPLNPVMFRFRVTGTGTSAITQVITFASADGSATGGVACANPGTGAIDYIPQAGTLTFAPGGTTFQDILVPVCGDTVVEGNETFTVTISGAPATVPPIGSVGTGTIVEDDSLVFRVDNVTGQEGNDPATTTNFVFRISKDGTTTQASNVSFVIEAITATGGAACGPGIDYISTPTAPAGGPPANPAVFAAATTFVNVTIRVCGDVVPEFDETFRLRLTGATVGTISTTNGTGIGTIVNDDGPVVPAGLEGDINRAVAGVCGPGDGILSAPDSAQFKRFIAGLDTPCTGDGTPGTFNEYQRTDTAPGATLGNGRLDATDQQQIDNYIAVLPAAPAAGGPTAPIPAPPVDETAARGDKSESNKGDDIGPETGGGREFRGVMVTGAPGDFVNYAVELISQGDETVTTLSLQFNQAVLSINGTSGTNNNPDVTAGTGANPGTSRTVNATQLANGRIGVLLDFQGAIAAGTRQVVVFRFRILPGTAAGTYPVTFVDQPIVRSTSNAAAQSLTAKYTASNVTVTGAGGGGNRTLTIGTVTAPNGGQAIVPLTLTNGGGNETAISGSFTFPIGANGLTISNVGGTNPDVFLGTGLPAGCTVTTNATQVATGSIGFLVACPTAIPAGTQQILRFRFGVPPGTPIPRTLPLAWSNTPIAQGVSDAQAMQLPTTFVNGAVNVDIPTAAGVSLSGRVTDANGAGVRNAIITVSGVGLEQPVRVVTGSLGYYSIENLEAGQTYLVSLRASKRYDFPNATRLVTLSDNVQDIDFVANPQ